MRIYISLIITVALIIGLGLGSLYLLNNCVDTVTANFNDWAKVIENGDWPKAEEYYQQTDALWQKKGSLCQIFIGHAEIDFINTTLTRLGACQTMKSKTDALIELKSLQQSLQHLPQKEQINWENIF